MNYKKVIFITLCAMVCACATAQIKLPTMNIDGCNFYYYQVNDKETIHGIAQKTGISADEIIEYNPSAASGINKKQLLLVPVDQPARNVSNTVAVTNAKAISYTLVNGDNIYTVAKKHNTTVEGLLNANLNIAPDKYVPGTKVKVVPNSALPFTYETTVVKFNNHIAANDESFYSIARKYNTTEEALRKLNPELKKPKKNKPVLVPVSAKVKVQGNMETISLDDLKANYDYRLSSVYNNLVEEQRKRVCNVGVILPFQLHKEEAPKQAYQYTDFLKGLMIAMDSLGNNVKRKINIKVYDTQHNLNVTDSLLALPEMAELNLIIAPEEPKQLERINAFGMANNINVLNCFSFKNEDYKTNPNSLVLNTPTPLLIANLTSWFKTRFSNCEVIFLNDNETSDMVSNIKSSFAEANIPCKVITVDGDLSYDALSNKLDPGTHYVFVPSNSGKGLLKRILPALKQVKSERFDCDINLLGLPEYVLYLKDYQNDLMTVDTYMFSRFFNAKGFRTRNVENSYKKWFGGQMLDAYPHRALLGFDTGCFIVNTLGQGNDINDDTELFKGIQTGFKFNHTQGCEGLVNQAVTLVHFSTDKKIESFVATDR